MNVLVTGARGFMGRNLCAALRNAAEGKDKTRSAAIGEVFEYGSDTGREALAEFCGRADFVFHLAGVNRPQDESEFLTGNRDFTAELLGELERQGNRCPVLMTSSIQAERDNPYGRSKRAGEELLFRRGERTGARVLVYRLPNVFGKWCRPDYNSAVATFCHNIARGLPIRMDDRETVLRLTYIDDVVDELFRALAGQETREGPFCRVPAEYSVSLGRIADLLYSFRASRGDLSVPDMADPFARKLYAAYLSYLPPDSLAYPLTKHEDARGSFTEILRTADRGQFSVNVSRPGITKGNHWHNTKNEKFLVVSGRGVIRFRSADPAADPAVREYYVSGDRPEVVDIPTGYTHNIENLGDGDMVTFMWASEPFDPAKPDTYFLEV